MISLIQVLNQLCWSLSLKDLVSLHFLNLQCHLWRFAQSETYTDHILSIQTLYIFFTHQAHLTKQTRIWSLQTLLCLTLQPLYLQHPSKKKIILLWLIRYHQVYRTTQALTQHHSNGQDLSSLTIAQSWGANCIRFTPPQIHHRSIVGAVTHLQLLTVSYFLFSSLLLAKTMPDCVMWALVESDQHTSLPDLLDLQALDDLLDSNAESIPLELPTYEMSMVPECQYCSDQ